MAVFLEKTACDACGGRLDGGRRFGPVCGNWPEDVHGSVACSDCYSGLLNNQPADKIIAAFRARRATPRSVADPPPTWRVGDVAMVNDYGSRLNGHRVTVREVTPSGTTAFVSGAHCVDAAGERGWVPLTGLERITEESRAPVVAPPATPKQDLCGMCNAPLPDPYHSLTVCGERAWENTGEVVPLDDRIAAARGDADDYEAAQFARFGRNWDGLCGPDEGGL